MMNWKRCIGVMTVFFLFGWAGVAFGQVSNGDFESSQGWTSYKNNSSWICAYDGSISHGGLTSYRISWPENGSGSVGAYAEIRQILTIPSASKYELDFWVKDDFSKGIYRRNYPYRQVLIDSTVVWEDSVQGEDDPDGVSDGWMHVVQDISDYVAGKSQVTLRLRVAHQNVVERSANMSMMLKTNLVQKGSGVLLGGYFTDNGTYSWAVTGGASPNAWSKLSGSTYVPDACSHMRIWCYPYQTQGDIWVDDIFYALRYDNRNGSFEYWDDADAYPDNWSNDGWGTTVISKSTTEKYSGNNSLNIYAGATASGGVLSDSFSVTPGEVIDLSMRLKTQLAAGGVYLGIQWNNDQYNYTWGVLNVTSAGSWSQKTGKITAPSGASSARIWVYPFNIVGSVWVDEVQMVRGLNASMENGTGSLPSLWAMDSYNTGVQQISWVTSAYYSPSKSVKFHSDSPAVGGIWSNAINLGVSITEPLLPVNVWWDDVSLKTDDDSSMMARRRNVTYGLGDYANPATYVGGSTNIDLTIQRLVDLNVKDYNYLIWYNKPELWYQLPEFLSKANQAGIRVWVALVPITEPPSSKPYGYNFVPDDRDADTADDNDFDGLNTDNWAYQIAKLSLTYPNLVGLYIDDYGTSGIEQASYIMKLATIMHSINPKLAIMPCIYYDKVSILSNAKLRSMIDGIVFPYRSKTDTTQIAAQIQTMRAALGENKTLLTMFYCETPATGAFISEAMTIAHNCAENDGIQLYCLNLTEGNTLGAAVKTLYSQWINVNGWRTAENELSASYKGIADDSGWVTETSHTGDHSVKIRKSQASGYSRWYGRRIDFTSPYPTNVTYGGWGKASEVGDQARFGVAFYLRFEDGSATWDYANLKCDNGTHDWQQVSLTRSFTKGIKSITPCCYFYDDVGTVWLDDIFVTINGSNVVYNPGFEISQSSETDTVEAITFVPGDANGDGAVNVGDLGILAANYNHLGVWSQGDFNNDGIVDVGDLGILAAHYGEGVSGVVDFNGDAARAFGETVEGTAPAEETSEDDGSETGSSLCSEMGLPLVAGLIFMGLMLVKLED
jgi:hypothetical protein